MFVWKIISRFVLFALKLSLVGAVGLAAAYGLGTWMIARAETAHALRPGVGRVMTVGTHRVRVVDAGAGEPTIMLIHGLPGSADDWPVALTTALGAAHRVVALDLLGFGYSDRVAGLDASAWATQVLDTAGALGITSAVLVGHDFGAVVAAHAAAAAPERTRALILVAPSLPLREEERPSRFGSYHVPGVGEFMAGWSPLLLRPDGAPGGVADGPWWEIVGSRSIALAAQRRGIDAEALTTAIRGLRVPTLVLHGANDAVVPPAATHRWATGIDRGLVQPIPSSGHWPAHDAPAVVAGAITSFVRRAGAAVE